MLVSALLSRAHARGLFLMIGTSGWILGLFQKVESWCLRSLRMGCADLPAEGWGLVRSLRSMGSILGSILDICV